MIKAVTVTNKQGESMRTELASPEKSGFVIQKIDGLGAPKATANIVSSLNGNIAMVNSVSVAARNIVLSLKPLPKPSVEDYRQETYRYFPIKQEVTILVETDNRMCETTGIVESNEPDIFNKNETIQISIVCPNPFFYRAGPDGTEITRFYEVDPLFEFEFSSEQEEKLEFGSIEKNAEKTIWYTGDSEIGILMIIHFLGEAKNIHIYNVSTGGSMTIKTDGLNLKSGDEIYISTLHGEKYARLLRNGAYTSILNALDKNSEWFTLLKGKNIFAFTADEGADNLLFSIESRVLYEGV